MDYLPHLSAPKLGATLQISDKLPYDIGRLGSGGISTAYFRSKY